MEITTSLYVGSDRKLDGKVDISEADWTMPKQQVVAFLELKSAIDFGGMGSYDSSLR